MLGVAGDAAGAAEEKPEERCEGEQNGSGFFAEKLRDGSRKANEVGSGDAVAVEIAEESVGNAEPGGAEPFARLKDEMSE